MEGRRAIKTGAEASLFEVLGPTYLGRERAVEKRRLPKRYRAKELDERIRDGRLRNEVRLMVEARSAGIPVPIVYDIDLGNKAILMERIEGSTVKAVLESGYGRKKALCRRIGRYVGILHANDLTHGDLTTSNMLLADERLYFIDFNMGARTGELEDKGVDLHLLCEAFKSSHPGHPEFLGFALEGYRESYSGAGSVIDKVGEIEKRGRYA